MNIVHLSIQHKRIEYFFAVCTCCPSYHILLPLSICMHGMKTLIYCWWKYFSLNLSAHFCALWTWIFANWHSHDRLSVKTKNSRNKFCWNDQKTETDGREKERVIGSYSRNVQQQFGMWFSVLTFRWNIILISTQQIVTIDVHEVSNWYRKCNELIRKITFFMRKTYRFVVQKTRESTVLTMGERRTKKRKRKQKITDWTMHWAMGIPMKNIPFCGWLNRSVCDGVSCQ